jgi:hypothetical protein
MNNNKSTFCTISTADHLYKTYALADSLYQFNFALEVLLIDKPMPNENYPKNITFHLISDIDDIYLNQLQLKYKGDNLRWSLKSVFLNYLLKNKEKVIYIDNDIFFYSNPSFLFEILNSKDILLTPHRYPINTEKNQNWLEANFRVGLFNAGFLGVNRKAKDTITWWTKACLYRCEKNYFRGLFDDQKYLDLIPILHANTEIIGHLGCNVSYWNKEICPIKIIEGRYWVAHKYPLVFYHFNSFSIQKLDKNEQFLKDYIDNLYIYNPSFEIKQKPFLERLIETLKLSIWNLINKFN